MIVVVVVVIVMGAMISDRYDDHGMKKRLMSHQWFVKGLRRVNDCD